MFNTTKLNIKSWSEEDRPREKMILKGREALSDAELIAILLGSGNKEQSAVSLAQTILLSTKSSLQELGKLDLSDFMKFKGIGKAKAVTIAAALELGRRRQHSDTKESKKITSSQDAYQIIAPLLQDINHEEFWMLLLNRAHKLIKKQKISSGGVSAVLVDPRLVFKPALAELASSIILVHNHPSDNLKPSQEDIRITTKLSEAAKLLDMQIVDHLIIGHTDYFSFADEGML